MLKTSSQNNEIAGHQIGGHGNKTKKLICVFLAMLILAVYWQIQNHEFINYDDNRYITENKHVTSKFSKESFIWVFTSSYASNWHPVTWLSHMLDNKLYGLNPKGHHLTSLAIHIANTLLLFLVLARMTGALWQSCFVASMFAFHPLNVESVAWAAERKNVLSTFFWLLTMWAYVGYVQKKNVTRYFLVVLFFALGLMSKAMLVTLPFILLLLDHWPLRRLQTGYVEEHVLAHTENYTGSRKEFSRLICEKVPLLALVIGSSIATFMAQKSGGAVESIKFLPLSVRINNALVSYSEYLGKMLWPKGLSVFYPHPVNELPIWKGLMSGLVLAGITIVVVRLIRRAPYLVVGWFWYLGTLVPVIGLVQVGEQAIADRYTYIPLVGIFIIIAWGLPELLKKYLHKNKLISILAGILICTLMTLTWIQLRYWENSTKLFKHAIAVTDKEYPSFVVVHNNLGVALNEQMKFEEAIVHNKKAIKLQPNYAQAHNNLGNSLSELNHLGEAITYYKEAIRLKPNYPEAHNNLANSLSKMMKMGEAILHYKEAIKLKPNFSEAHFNLGITLNKWNNFEEAIVHLREAIRLEPNFSLAHSTFGNILGKKGDFKTAIDHLETAIKIDPNNANTHNNLGSVLGEQGNFSKAIAHFNMAIKINPDYTEAHQNLGLALSILGRSDESTYHLKIAQELTETAISKKTTIKTQQGDS